MPLISEPDYALDVVERPGGGRPLLSEITAVVLAGGFGTRLRPAVDDRPKVLALVNGRPFLSHLLDQLTRAGVRRAVLCTGYLGDQVQDTFGTAYGPLLLGYSRETTPLGTAGAVRRGLNSTASDPVLVMNGDSYCQVDLTAFMRWHQERPASGSLVLTHVRDVARYGQVHVAADGAVQRFEEKVASAPGGWINAGIYLLSRRLVAAVPEDRCVSIEREVFPTWIGRGLYGYSAGGRFLDIGTPASYAEASTFLSVPA